MPTVTRVVTRSLAAVVAAHGVGYLVNRWLLPRERARLQPTGQLIDIDGHRVHVVVLGEGEQTVVVLGGANVPLPSADLGPVMRRLATRATVACVELPGTGLSDPSPAPRTNPQLTHELRTALAGAGLQPPYVLVPHSASGIVCEHLASQHPDEVAGIVMLDTTSSAVDDTPVPALVFRLAQLQQLTGVARIITRVAVRWLLRPEHGFTDQEIRSYRMLANQPMNATALEQNLRFPEQVRDVMQRPFPATVPVHKIVPTGTWNRMGEEYQREHLQRLGPHATLEVVDGSHFVHHTNADRIVEATLELLERRART